MTTLPLFSGFDGLMNLSRREGVDIRPTLLRVLADLYVQTNTHSEQEARQFVELTSRLIDQVDDATRAAVRARLALYPATPAPVLKHLGLKHLVLGLGALLAASTQGLGLAVRDQGEREEAISEFRKARDRVQHGTKLAEQIERSLAATE